jgi:hypothetical protein
MVLIVTPSQKLTSGHVGAVNGTKLKNYNAGVSTNSTDLCNEFQEN